jgi:hypothetical protein
MHEGHFFLAVVVIIVAFFGLLIWAGIHGDLDCPEGKHRILIGKVPVCVED